MIKDSLNSRTKFFSYWTRRKIQCKYSRFVTVSRYLSFYVFCIKIKFCGIVTWRILFKIRWFMIMRCDWSFLGILKYLGHESEERTAATDGAVSQLKLSITKQMLKVLKDLFISFSVLCIKKRGFLYSFSFLFSPFLFSPFFFFSFFFLS